MSGTGEFALLAALKSLHTAVGLSTLDNTFRRLKVDPRSRLPDNDLAVGLNALKQHVTDLVNRLMNKSKGARIRAEIVHTVSDFASEYANAHTVNSVATALFKQIFGYLKPQFAETETYMEERASVLFGRTAGSDEKQKIRDSVARTAAATAAAAAAAAPNSKGGDGGDDDDAGEGEDGDGDGDDDADDGAAADEKRESKSTAAGRRRRREPDFGARASAATSTTAPAASRVWDLKSLYPFVRERLSRIEERRRAQAAQLLARAEKEAKRTAKIARRAERERLKQQRKADRRALRKQQKAAAAAAAKSDGATAAPHAAPKLNIPFKPKSGTAVPTGSAPPAATSAAAPATRTKHKPPVPPANPKPANSGRPPSGRTDRKHSTNSSATTNDSGDADADADGGEGENDTTNGDDEPADEQKDEATAAAAEDAEEESGDDDDGSGEAESESETSPDEASGDEPEPDTGSDDTPKHSTLTVNTSKPASTAAATKSTRAGGTGATPRKHGRTLSTTSALGVDSPISGLSRSASRQSVFSVRSGHSSRPGSAAPPSAGAAASPTTPRKQKSTAATAAATAAAPTGLSKPKSQANAPPAAASTSDVKRTANAAIAEKDESGGGDDGDGGDEADSEEEIESATAATDGKPAPAATAAAGATSGTGGGDEQKSKVQSVLPVLLGTAPVVVQRKGPKTAAQIAASTKPGGDMASLRETEQQTRDARATQHAAYTARLHAARRKEEAAESVYPPPRRAAIPDPKQVKVSSSELYHYAMHVVKSMSFVEGLVDIYLYCLMVSLVSLCACELRADTMEYRDSLHSLHTLASHFIRYGLPVIERLMEVEPSFVRDNIFGMSYAGIEKGYHYSDARQLIRKLRVFHQTLTGAGDIYVFPTTLPAHPTGCKCITVSHLSHEFVLTGGYDGAIRIWDVSTPDSGSGSSGTCLAQFIGHESIVTFVRFNSTDTWIVTGSFDGTIRVWNCRTGKLLRVLSGHEDGVLDGDLSGSTHYHHSAAATPPITGTGTGAGAAAAAANNHHLSKNEYIVSGSMDCTVRLWSSATGNCIRLCTGHKHWVKCVRFTPDSNHFISAGLDKQILVWSTRLNAHALAGSPVPAPVPIASAAGATAPVSVTVSITAAAEASIALPGSAVPRVITAELHDDYVLDMCMFGSDKIITASKDKTIRVWNYRTEKQIAVLRNPNYSATTAATGGSGAAGGVSKNGTGSTAALGIGTGGGAAGAPAPLTLSVSGDGRWLACGYFDHTIVIYDTDTFQVIRQLKVHNDGVLVVRWLDRSGKRLAVGAANGNLQIIEL